jgi:hypothetical protein
MIHPRHRSSGCAVLAAVLAGCMSSPQVTAVRFANAPAVQVVDDRREVPRPPESRDYKPWLYYFDGVVARPIDRTLAVPRPRRAEGVNALDEVPDSTWFTNRLGVRAMSVGEVRRGPEVVGSPESHTPFTIKSSKLGEAPGFIIEDARGERFLLKFDRSGMPEAESAADAITSRLLWAAGYNVPEDHVVYVHPDDLVIGPGAVGTDGSGNKRALTQADVNATLAHVEELPGGWVRGLASHLIKGTLLGGHPEEGVRHDDPNDRIAHEMRRDLRGQYALFAWLDNADVKEGNTLDTWITEPGRPDRHYVQHYLVDFGKSLGVLALSTKNLRKGHEYQVDWTRMARNLVTLGIPIQPWEGRPIPGLRGIGVFEAATYDPSGWRPHSQAYRPLVTADRFDHFWASKILIRFTPEQLRAVVETARLSDPRAAEYLLQTLITRQRQTAAYWFQRVNPLDAFELQDAAGVDVLCFDDLAVAYGLASGRGTQYVIESMDHAGAPIGPAVQAGRGAARTCSGPLSLRGGDGYTILRITTTGRGITASTDVHIARDPSSRRPRIVGIWRS